MTPTPFNETDEFKIGDALQRYIFQKLMSEGRFCIASYDFSAGNNKAPKLCYFLREGERMFFDKERGYALPDIQAFKDGGLEWIEVKYKRVSPIYRKFNRHQHGINGRLYNDYREVQKVTGGKVWIYLFEHFIERKGDFAEMPSNKLLRIPLDTIEETIQTDKSANRINPDYKIPMVYWARDSMEEIPFNLKSLYGFMNQAVDNPALQNRFVLKEMPALFQTQRPQIAA